MEHKNLISVSRYWKKKLYERDIYNELNQSQEFLHESIIKGDELEYFNKLTNTHQIAKFTVICAVYNFLLKRLIRDFDGFIVSNFKDQSNTLAFSFSTDLKTSFKEYLKPLKDEILETLNYSNYENETLDLVKGLSELKFSSRYGININSHKKSEPIGLLLDVKIKENHDLEIKVFYQKDFVNSSIINYLVKHFRNFIINLEENIEVDLSEYDLLTISEKEQLLVDFNKTKIDYPQNKTIVDLFEERVKKSPENVATIFQNSELTYKELNEKANQLAHFISSEYVINRGDIIGVFLPKSENAIISLLAILKIGAVYLPIDMNYPQERIDYLINDSGIRILIGDGSSYPETNCEKIDVNHTGLKNCSEKNIGKEILTNDLAYIIYTSGSTGQPKGVMVEHTSNVNMSLDQIRAFNITENDKIVWFASVSFDASISEIMMALYSGATLCIPTQEIVKDKNEFVTFLKATKSSVVTFPPSYLGLLSNVDISDLRCIITAGESANSSKANEIVKLGKEYYNAYGPTECAVCVTTYRVTESDSETTNISIGKPIANTQIYILDDSLQPVPIGVSGKIYVSGVGVARGYLNKLELTNEKFILNPFIEDCRMYDTGDLGCWLPNGNIEFLGRKDNQVKLRGYRIELGEIENIAMQYSESIKQVAVEVKEHNQENVLVAYFVSDSILDKSELRAFLQSSLPDYMLPSFYVALEKLPITPNGKIDRKALPEILGDQSIRAEYSRPINKTQKVLVSIWQEILRIEKIGINDNFFELGGHSLMISQVINRVNKQLGKSLSFKVFLSNTTIAELSEQLKDSTYESIPPAAESLAYPLTASQSRIWILSQLDGGSLAYNMPAAVRLTGEIDFEKFEKSFQFLIKRHEILRTNFKTNADGEVYQYILPSEEIEFKIQENDFSKDVNPESKLISYLDNINEIQFNLEQAPLVRAALTKLADKEYVFFLSLHHIIGDGWSIELLISEIVTAYNDLISGRTTTLPELTIHYKDYAVWLNEELYKEEYLKSEQYWLEKYKGELPVLNLPTFKKRPLVQTYNGNTLKAKFSSEFLEKLKAFSKKNDVTLFMTLMSGINALLNRYTGQNDIVIGTPIAGREHPDLENQIGLFLNTLPIRTQFEEKSTFLGLLEIQKETLLAAYDHQIYPFDALVNKLNLKKDTSRSPLFDVLVVLQNQNQLQNINNDKFSDIEISDFELKTKTAQLDISFTFVEKDGLELSIEYNTDIYDHYLINRIFAHFENLMDQLIQNPEKQIQEIDYLIEEEKIQLISTFNETEIDFLTNETLVELFEKQCENSLEDVVVVNEDIQLTYKELNEKANQLGSYLREKYAIKSDDLIGIKLDRNAQLIIAILGVLKSGAAYVYIDPSYPKERVSFLQKDSNAKVIIDEFEIDEFIKIQSNYQKTNLSKINHSQNLAYIIYTSGTTGNPKGVMVEHKNVVNTLFAEIENLKLENKVNTCTITNPSFDVSILEIFIPFLTGGTIYIPNAETAIIPESILKYISQHPVNLLQGTPTYWKSILNEVVPSENEVKNLCIGGESLEAGLLDKFSKYFKKAKINNNYGPTETTIDAIVLNDVKEFENNCIGKPIANTQVFILDKNKHLVPIGVKGTIYIGGAGVSRGYLNNSELTNEKFFNLNHQFVDVKVYDTGDLGTWMPDGSILFYGRRDEQIKLRGYRIELSEIEQNILSFSNVITQVVVDVKTVETEQQLIAYYVTQNDAEIDVSNLNMHLISLLPNYMIPSFYIPIDAIPLTTNGKVNKKELPNPDTSTRIRKEYVAPSNDVEVALVEFWQEILNIDGIGVQENFFELGGNSLKVVKLFEKIKNNIYPDITIGQLFSNPTINQQSKLIQNNKTMVNEEILVNELDF
jgi:amino acid adenylation domain-containing protein